MMIYFEQQPNRITAVRSVDGITSMNIYIIIIVKASYPSSFQLLKSFIWILHHSIELDRETSEFNGNRGILHLFFTKNLINNVSGERLKSTLMFEMRTIESEDCSWSHFEQILHRYSYTH
ncbi:hypothetical protein T10_8242 [Trichinella papuae]|uniref:Uncharacterized protein n=1 Tax=Trichinella papuae TaxID=268474 RepID=A0A0V1M0U6_9BILA|nr:hypothetical protein T10_8242 [Trichinella papuae]